MKGYFNSFDDVQFFHTFSSISRDMKIVTLNEIHRYIQNFMLYKMIHFSSHKFAFSNLRFSPFYEHFRELCEKYAFKLKNKVHHVNQLIEPHLMMYIHMTFCKKTTPLHALHLAIQNILLAVNPFQCFFAKSWWAGKNNKSIFL